MDSIILKLYENSFLNEWLLHGTSEHSYKRILLRVSRYLAYLETGAEIQNSQSYLFKFPFVFSTHVFTFFEFFVPLGRGLRQYV